MKLEKVTAEIRPRGRWESIDLGCALVRENYGKIMSAWFLTVIPMWLMVIALSQLWPAPEGRPWVAGIFCLWTLPVCDRVPLLVLSRRLFGEDLATKELLLSFPKMITRRWFNTLLVGPFSINRCLANPVSELEGLKRKSYRERVHLLSRNGGEGAMQAGLISIVLVLATMFSMLFVFSGIVGLFGDSIVLEELWVKHVLGSDAAFIPVPYVWVLVGLMLSAITIIEPFYVGAGFSMYINSRTITEGWDIELAFKRMNQRVVCVLRKTQGGVLLFILGLLLSYSMAPVYASNARLDEVMEHEDFVIRTEVELVPIANTQGPSNWDWNFDGLSFLPELATVLFYLIVTAVACLIGWFIYSNRHLFTGAKLGASSNVPKIRSVMGMDVTPESLPDDVVNAARSAWDAGQHQLAMGLLYRGSISWFVNEMSLCIKESDTEQDCLSQVKQQEQKELVEHFEILTRQWIELAYGGVAPTDKEILWLCHYWPYKKDLERSDR